MTRFSIITDDMKHCIECGRLYPQLHEIFFGARRNKSIEYGLVIPLCIFHHTEHKTGIHHNHELDMKWKVKGQEAFEEKYPELEFIKIFYKNYK